MTIPQPDILDRSDGNGSRSAEEDWLDDNTTAAENEWSSANTTFYYWEADDDRFRRLYDAHHGKGDPNRSSELPRMRIMADTKAFASMLELPEQVREDLLYIMQRIDISPEIYGGKSYEKMILAVSTLVHDKYLSSRPTDEVDYKQRLIFDDTFCDLMETNSLESKELRGIREQIRTKSEFF